MTRLEALQVTPSQDHTTLSPAQKRFNSLIKQIAKQRQTLAAWAKNTEHYRQVHAETVQPLIKQLANGQRPWVFALDAALDRHALTPAERELLREMIVEAAGELLEAHGPDADLDALFLKHAEIDFATDQRERMREMKGMTENLTGLDLGDEEGLASDQDLAERLRQAMQRQAAEQQAHLDEKNAKRRKTAAQQRREDEDHQATQSVREIYRKLASALHPDREPDAGQRQAKTEMMKRVNQAYEANNLLALLELQLEIEQIDESHIANASQERLKHYNKVLGEQLSGIKAEVEHAEIAFRMEFGLLPSVGVDPRYIGPLFDDVLSRWVDALERQQQELRILDDAKATKRWLKQQQKAKQRRENDFDFPMF
ncbi:hypothetical protein GT347_01495 [Xylophilus rhododendri]|uniref:Molecular chaperone DnaJ n=1 Tax=Xylophilus rhododendri TaxID=2697032 RepID=A0A857J0S0_9BURK|nr:J domain-containing protein [Xylophilus rhododendri]QHI96779.1 hypothetical protein GT347_01495 [Xylophilus rhododendri]